MVDIDVASTPDKSSGMHLEWHEADFGEERSASSPGRVSIHTKLCVSSSEELQSELKRVESTTGLFNVGNAMEFTRVE
jgi:hypothetical protein